MRRSTVLSLSFSVSAPWHTLKQFIFRSIDSRPNDRVTYVSIKQMVGKMSVDEMLFDQKTSKEKEKNKSWGDVGSGKERRPKFGCVTISRKQHGVVITAYVYHATNYDIVL